MRMSFERPSVSAEHDPRTRWVTQEANVLDRAARLGTRELPEAQALVAACEAMTRRLIES